MSSNLKRIKSYFLTVAISSFVIILVSNSWNITENVYRVSSERSQVGIDKLQSPDVRMTDSPDVRMTERATGNFRKHDTRTLATEHVRNVTAKIRSKIGKETGTETDYLKFKSTILIHKKNETMIKKKDAETMEDRVQDLRPEIKRNSTFTQSTAFKVDDHGTKNSNETTKADRQLDVEGKVSQTINETAKSLNSVIHDNRKLISKSVVYSNVTSRPDVCAGCFKNNFRKIINEPNLCDGDVELLFMIASVAAKKDSRNAIRKTWCGDCNKPDSKMRLVFVFGNKHDFDKNENLLEESKEFHDIIQMDFVDTYANLTYKTMSSLQWSEDYCKQAKYVMKTDDDMYINTELLPLLLKAAPSEKFIGGTCWGPGSPIRNSKSKWYASVVQYRHSRYPAMCSGTGYVMSRDVVSGILQTSPNVPFFYLEDVYIAICANTLGLHPVKLKGFKNNRARFDPCSYRNQIITSHRLNAHDLHYEWTESRTCPKADLRPEMVYKPFPV